MTTHYDRFFTRRYRLLVRMGRGLRPRDIFDFLLVVIAAFIAILGRNQQYAVPAFVIYLVVAIVRFSWAIRERKARYAMRAYTVGGLFNFINKELFIRSNYTRYTVFDRAPFRRNHITPWCRWFRGCRNVIEEADESRARYRHDKRRPEGITGKVWVRPASSLLFNILPRFECTEGATKREVMEAYYIKELQVRPETAQAISNYMEDVRAILSYTFLDNQDQFLGLLSLDLHQVEVGLSNVEVDGAIGNMGVMTKRILKIDPYENTEDEFSVDADALFLLTRAIGNVLESFKNFERGDSTHA